jgi:SAM-dependent methyltransferase
MPAATHLSTNHWPETACARAFWGQHELPPYRRLLADTLAWLEPRPGESWLDLGCGCGQVTQALWAKGGGTLMEVIGLDCAAVNERAYQKLKTGLGPLAEERIHFLHADFAGGLASLPAGRFDGVVSGLAIQYADSYSAAQGRWTTEGYDRVLAEVRRVLRRGGWFVFSVNVPEPAWGKVALRSLTGVFRARNKARFLKNALRMWRYGSWLTREARRGRFHYLPLSDILQRLAAAGFIAPEHRVSYAGQAYLLRCRKPY